MKRFLLPLCISLFQSVGMPALADNSFDKPMHSAFASVGEKAFFPIGFPSCVMQFQSFTEELNAAGALLRSTRNVDLGAGVFRGTWALKLPDGHDYEGSYVVELKCGSGLGQITALPN